MDIDANFSLTFAAEDAVLATKAPEETAVVDEFSIGTIAIIVVVAISTISLLFAIAIFIDCRIQKLNKSHSANPRTLFKCRLPGFGRNYDEDEDTFVDKMQDYSVA